MGMVMQVLVIAMQNGVAYGDLGVATSGATLCRLIGGSLGTAAFGAIFAVGLTAHRADRDLVREYIHTVVGNARVDPSPLAAWLLVRLHREPGSDLETLPRRFRIDPARLGEAAAELRDRGLVLEAEDGEATRQCVVTKAGNGALPRLAAARRTRFGGVLAEWAPDQRQALLRSPRPAQHGGQTLNPSSTRKSTTLWIPSLR